MPDSTFLQELDEGGKLKPKERHLYNETNRIRFTESYPSHH